MSFLVKLQKIIPDRRIVFIFILLILVFGTNYTFASTTDGTIDTTNRYAYMESGSWIDFGSTQGNVYITDSALTGYAWSAEYGWISLNCSNDSSCSTVDYKVSNDGNGILSGYAWSETFGWIDFKPTNGGVTIDSSGVFSGRAWGDQIGWITFNCSSDSSCGIVDYKVSTDWRPSSSRTSTVTTQSGGSSSSSGSSRRYVATTITAPVEIVSDFVDDIVPDFFKPKAKSAPEKTPEVQVSKITPSALNGSWNLLPVTAIGKFVFAPLPQGILALEAKFPSLKKTLSQVGVNKLSDLDKLQDVKLSLPGLTERSGIAQTSVVAGSFKQINAIPLAKLQPIYKDALPKETIFARTGGELIDLNPSIVIADTGDVSQKINIISGEKLHLAIKVEDAVSRMEGYLTFRKRNALTKEDEYPHNMLASVINSLPIFAKEAPSKIPVEDKLVLVHFDYSDPDGDNIWTADLDSPVVAGEYEIMTIISYTDPDLGTRQVNLITVVDPEGYVYEKNGSKETRIPDAVVSIYVFDKESGQYKIWPAQEYHQENPQKTGISGTYSFLVPPGNYKISVTASGYKDHNAEPFDVVAGGGIHQNIELIPKNAWLKIFDWKVFIIIIVVLLLAYNFYRDWKRDRRKSL